MKSLHFGQVHHRIGSVLVVVGDHSCLIQAQRPQNSFQLVFIQLFYTNTRRLDPTSSVCPSGSST